MINVGGTCTDPRGASDAAVLQNLACFHSVEDADTVEIDYAKVTLRGEPTEGFNFQLAYQMQDDKIGARRSTTLGSPPLPPAQCCT